MDLSDFPSELELVSNSFYYHPVPKAEISIAFSYLFFLFSSLSMGQVS